MLRMEAQVQSLPLGSAADKLAVPAPGIGAPLQTNPKRLTCPPQKYATTYRTSKKDTPTLRRAFYGGVGAAV